jgi:hypothetical protein
VYSCSERKNQGRFRPVGSDHSLLDHSATVTGSKILITDINTHDSYDYIFINTTPLISKIKYVTSRANIFSNVCSYPNSTGTINSHRVNASLFKTSRWLTSITDDIFSQP